MLKIPEKTPELGFYYHYKHDPTGPMNNYVYEIMGVGFHTEDDCRPEDAVMVVYRPLYPDAAVYKSGKAFDLRPLGMFMENVTKDGKTILRFTRITDPAIIKQLEEIKRQMYGV